MGRHNGTYRPDTILPKTIAMDKVKDPLQSTVYWIEKVVYGVYKKRTQPIKKMDILNFFPFTSTALFEEAFSKAIAEKIICLTSINKSRGHGYLIAGKDKIIS